MSDRSQVQMWKIFHSSFVSNLVILHSCPFVLQSFCVVVNDILMRKTSFSERHTRADGGRGGSQKVKMLDTVTHSFSRVPSVYYRSHSVSARGDIGTIVWRWVFIYLAGTSATHNFYVQDYRFK